MNETNRRWEWRSFGDRFAEAEERLAERTPTGVQESDEVYLLSRTGDNVKIRDGQMDIKVLREVNADGLEQWAPAMQTGFPLAADEAARVFESLRLEAPSPSPAGYTWNGLMDALARSGAAVRRVEVHKRRIRYRLDDCLAELTDVVADGRHTRTLAIESEDAQAVIRLVRELGLGGCTNTSYPRGLEALLDDEPGP